MSTPKIKLSYFDIEGAAEPVRLAFLLTKTPFEDHRVQFADWPALKPTTPGGQLPVLTVDDGPMHTQSKAMLRWVGHSFSKTLYDTNKILDIEEAIGCVEDMQRDFMPAFSIGRDAARFGHPANFAETEEGKACIQKLRETFAAESFPTCLKRLSGLLAAHGGQWLVAGDEPTVADCLAVPFLRSFTRGHIDHISTSCLDDHPAIVQYIKNFCALDSIKGRYTDGIHE